MRTVFLCAIGLVACGKASNDASVVGKPAAAAFAVKPLAVAVPAPGLAKTQLAALTDCTSELTCDAFDALVEIGAQAGPEVLAFVEDTGHSDDARRLAARVLGRIQYAPAGPRLVALANQEPDVLTEIDLFKAAGECGGDDTFTALASEYARENHGDAGDHLVGLRDGLKAFPHRALPWALDAMTRGGKDITKYADVMCDVATPADRDTIVALVGTTHDYMVEDRLAAKAISLGATDAKLYDTLLAGLASESDRDREDAAMFVRAVATKLPMDRKQKAIDLIQHALLKADPMVAATLKSSLAKL